MSTPHEVCYNCLAVTDSNPEACPGCGSVRPPGGWGLDPLIGLVLGDRYRLEGRLGAGGMGTVYKAHRTGSLGGHVAVKVLSPALSKTVVAKRFEREARVVSQLSSPHIVRVYDFASLSYPIDGTPLYYLAMELVDGDPLSKVLEASGKVSFPWAIEVLRQTAMGLDEAHELGITHRDLKPSNLMVQQQRRSTHIKILDFGIASITEDPTGGEVEKLTRTGLVTGTPDYMAPEQAMGGEITAAADMYSLGVMAFQMFTGALPFSGPTAMSVLTKRVTEPAPKLATMIEDPALPPAIFEIVDRLLAREPEDRFQNAGELLDALAAFPSMALAPDAVPDRAFLDRYTAMTPHEGSPVVDQSAPTEVVSFQGDSGREGTDAASGNGRGLVLLLVALVVLGGGGFAAWYFLAGPGAGEPAPASAPVVDRSEAVPPDDKAEQPANPPNTGDSTPPASDRRDRKGIEGSDEDPTAPPATTLEGVRPAVPDGYERVATLGGVGDATLSVWAPKSRPPLYQPMPLRLQLDRGETALRLSRGEATVKLQTRGDTVGRAVGIASAKDGRLSLDVPPLPVAAVYLVDLEYGLPDGQSARARFAYDAVSGAFKAP